MTPEIHLRELELRVVHRGTPWLDREALIRSGERIRRLILVDLDRLLGEALLGRGPDAALDEIDLAIEFGAGGVKVRLRPDPAISEARGRAAADAARPDHRIEPAGSGTIRAQIAPPHPLAISPPAASPRMAGAAARGADALLAVLLDWHAEASLARRLALLPEALLGSWRRLLSAMLAPSPRRDGPGGMAIHESASPARAAGLEQLPQRAQASFHSESEALLALIALIARHAPHRPPPIEIETLLSHAAADPTASSRVSSASAANSPSPTPAPARRAASTAASEVADRHGAALETAAIAPVPSLAPALAAIALIENALPFLMLGPLDRIGWLHAAGAALAAADLGEAAPALGFALALKALPPPARGWRHDPAQLQAAALAAGIGEPLPGERIAAFERALGGRLALADAVIADALLRGRSKGVPLALVAGDGWVALIEPEGLFPLAIGASWGDIAAVAVAAAAPISCGPQAATPELLRAIDQGGLTFAAHGAPGKNEAWRPIAGRSGWRGMTNGDPAAHRRLARAAAWAEDEERVLTMLNAFGKDRPIAGAQAGGVLDRSLTLAATVALGDIAWRLHGVDPAAWAKPEASLAFERFADLSARVDIDADRIELLLPLGPRARDLAAGGLCADVAAIPWLGRRRLRFAIG